MQDLVFLEHRVHTSSHTNGYYTVMHKQVKHICFTVSDKTRAVKTGLVEQPEHCVQLKCLSLQ